jgi:hypothetical protein
MLEYVHQCDEDFGRRVAEGVGLASPAAMATAGDD